MMENYYIKKVHDMNELEMQALLNEISDVIDRNKWEHLVYECFGVEEYDAELNPNEIQKLRNLLRDVQSSADEAEHDAGRAVDILDKIQKNVSKQKTTRLHS